MGQEDPNHQNQQKPQTSSSRLIVRNLPKHLNEKRFKEHFETKGEVTDVKILKTQDGRSRQFGFVGFRSEKDAKAARWHFNNTFIDTSKIQVDFALPVGESSIPRPWSKYSKGSSRFTERERQANGSNSGGPDAKGKDAQNTKIKKVEDFIKELESQDPMLREFLAVMQPSHTKKLWANDDALGAEPAVKRGKRSKAESSNAASKEPTAEEISGKIEVSKTSKASEPIAVKKTKLGPLEATTELIRSKKHGGENVILKRTHVKFDDDSGSSEDEYQDLAAAADAGEGSAEDSAEPSGVDPTVVDPTVSDLEYLRSRVSSRVRDDSDDGDEGDEEGTAPDEADGAGGGAERGSDSDLGSDAEVGGPDGPTVPADEPTATQAIPSSQPQTRPRRQRKGVRFDDSTGADGDPEVSGTGACDGERKAGEGEEGEEVVDVADTGRLFVRNLAYSVTEDELAGLFTKYGPLSDVHVVVDSETKKGKGIAFVQFMMPEHAVKALSGLDGHIFQGRILHIIAAKAAPKPKQPEGKPGAATSSFKRQQEAKRAAMRDSDVNWNSAFIRGDTAVGAVASEMGLTKADVLDRDADSMAVRVALAETHVINATKQLFLKEGISLDALSTNDKVKRERSKTAMLVKNLSVDTQEADLRQLFGQYGSLAKVVLPPSKAMAVVQFLERGDAKRAMRALAYKHFKHQPLYIEWAPLNIFTTPLDPSPTTPSTDPSAVAAIPAEDEEVLEGTRSVFVKNLNFATTEQALRAVFETVAPVRSVRIATKRDTRKGASPGAVLSMGYGFVEFSSLEAARDAIKKLQNYRLDDHTLQLKLSHARPSPSTPRLSSTPAPPPGKANAAGPPSKGGKRPADAGKDTAIGPVKPKSAKLLLKNVPFEATKKELRELFRPFGEVKSVRIPKKFDGGHRGFAFVEFISKTEAGKAKEALRNTHLYGRHLVLDYAVDDSTIEAARLNTIKHFHGGAAPSSKRRKVTMDGADDGGGGALTGDGDIDDDDNNEHLMF